MAKSTLTALYENVSGKLNTGGKDKECKQQILAKHLKNSDHHNRVYLGNPSVRSTPVSAKERTIRNKFTVCQQAAKERSEDLGHLTADQSAYAEARMTTGFKYHSFRMWLVGRAYAYYNTSTNKVDWPENL